MFPLVSLNSLFVSDVHVNLRWFSTFTFCVLSRRVTWRIKCHTQTSPTHLNVVPFNCLVSVSVWGFFSSFFEKPCLFSQAGFALFKVFPHVINYLLDKSAFKGVSLCIQLNASCWNLFLLVNPGQVFVLNSNVLLIFYVRKLWGKWPKKHGKWLFSSFWKTVKHWVSNMQSSFL